MIRTQLIIAPTSLTWNGRLKNKAQYDALTALSQNPAYDADFLAAAAQIILELTVTPITIMLKPPIPLRPQQTDLPDVLAAKLLIGRYRLRFHGLMTINEGQALLKLVQGYPAGSAGNPTLVRRQPEMRDARAQAAHPRPARQRQTQRRRSNSRPSRSLWANRSSDEGHRMTSPLLAGSTSAGEHS